MEEGYIMFMLKNKKIDYDQLLYEKQKIIEWLIDGYGIHNIPISSVNTLTKEFIIENYNVNPSFFIKK